MDPAECDEREPVLLREHGNLVERFARVRLALLLREEHVRQSEAVVRLRNAKRLFQNPDKSKLLLEYMYLYS